MENGIFYFLADEYFEKFSDEKIMKNKEIINGEEHNRPCYYAFKDHEDERILWMIPVSSKIEKYRDEYDKTIGKYGICDKIVFGYVKGNENVFLLQNMCPTIRKYILNEYRDAQSNTLINIPNDLKKDLNKKARKLIRLAERGQRIPFTNIMSMRQALIKELEENI